MLYKKRAGVLKFPYPSMGFTYGEGNIVPSLRGWREKVVIFFHFLLEKGTLPRYHP